MQILIKRHFSTIKTQIEQLKTPFSNIPNNIHQLVDRQLLTISNHPLSIIKEKIKQSLTDTYTVMKS